MIECLSKALSLVPRIRERVKEGKGDEGGREGRKNGGRDRLILRVFNGSIRMAEGKGSYNLLIPDNLNK